MKYDKLIEKLSKLPKMDGAFVYDNADGDYLLRDGKKVEAVLIRFTANDMQAAEDKMIHEVMNLIRGKEEVWVRVMPEINSTIDEDTGITVIKGYARIATSSLECF